jgi:hypothetical protein
MCSCSGSCNCNSTTIPRGPQGLQGIPGPTGPASNVPGPVGSVGPAGISAFTTLTSDFIQPVIGDNNTINVLNTQWMAVNEIIYIGPAPSGLPTNAGGFYRIFAIPNSLQVTVVNLGWVIPGVTFISPGSIVGAVGTIVTPSGTIGATGEQGPTGTTIPGGLIITDVLTSQTLGPDLGVDITMPFSIIETSGNGVTFEIDVFANTSGATSFEILDVTGSPVTKLSPISLPTADTQYKFHIKLFMVKVGTSLRVSTSILGRELNDGGSYIDTDVNIISTFGITDKIYRFKFNDASSSNSSSLIISKLFNPIS